jgi:hypothetical protein
MTIKAEEPVQVKESELDAPVWSVVSFDCTEAAHLTYPDAIAKMAELDKRRVPGLCIITDDAAARSS